MVQSSDADIRPDSLKANAVMAPLNGWWEFKMIILHKYFNKSLYKLAKKNKEDHSLTPNGHCISLPMCVSIYLKSAVFAVKFPNMGFKANEPS